MLITFARVFGAIFIVVGALGFVPPLVPNGNLLGLFPVNAVHNLVHVGLGVWGVVAGISLAAAVIYFRGIAIIYGLLAILGSSRRPTRCSVWRRFTGPMSYSTRCSRWSRPTLASGRNLPPAFRECKVPAVSDPA